MSANLAQLGWDESWSSQSSPDPQLRPARVARTDRGRCVVHTGDGTQHARLSPDLQPAPTTGDWVLLDADGTVTAVLPRRTTVIRGAGRNDARGQVLAANVDVLFVISPLSTAPNLGRLERMLALAWESGARPVVLLTKADLSADPEADRAEAAQAALGVDVIAASVVDGLGFDEVRALLPAGRTGALIGPSGSGKSSLVNALADEETLTTGDIRSDGKGRHTSTARELVPMPWGALLLDTPGLRGVQLWDSAAGIEQTFSDIETLATECRFGDCTHHGEPGCAVAGAVADGALSARRLANYEKLLREQTWLAGRYDARLRAEQRRVWKVQAKAYRQRPAR
ncbi:MAG: ribosome small subunit-dependent GTPase A [Pseudonocardiales bacterium]|nr:MAG: ribosome small subunit-dependent GTPase A [Pseudonocardiales bacterium]